MKRKSDRSQLGPQPKYRPRRNLKRNLPADNTDEHTQFRNLYYSFNSPAGFGGENRFLDGVKKYIGRSKGILKRARQWLAAADSYSVHRPRRTGRKRPRMPTIVSGVGVMAQMDLADFPRFSQFNDGNRYILVCIDAFSWMVWAESVTDKSAASVVRAANKIFTRMRNTPTHIQTDTGKEFYNVDFTRLMKKYKMTHYSTRNMDKKATIAERFIRTLKDKIYRFLTFSSGFRYSDVLQKIVQQYNNTIHSSIGIEPSRVNYSNQEEIFNRLQNDERKPSTYGNNKRPSRLMPGDNVRLSSIRSTFDKSSTANWTEEIFKVKTVKNTKPNVYKLVDLNDESVEGIFYDFELQKVPVDVTEKFFKIESIIKKKKVAGRWHYFVKFLGYDDSFNDWVTEIDENGS